jgi:RimJ/RimL family protein N-acetyltransferase
VFQWAIVPKVSPQVIGRIAAVKLDEEICSAAIGYCLGKAYWGQGLMPEALTAVMRFLFFDVGMNRIAACHDVNNPKSGRVMEKAGMKYEGTLRQAGRNNQGICDLVVRAALRSEWTIPE